MKSYNVHRYLDPGHDLQHHLELGFQLTHRHVPPHSLRLYNK